METSHSKFHHPYEPYDIQLDFMQKLYKCIEDGNIGLFESPTGTGKSLSLICAALTWLRDDEKRRVLGVPNGETEPIDWLTQAEKEIQKQQLLRSRQEFEDKLKHLRLKARREKKSNERVKKVKLDVSISDDDLVLDEYHSDDDGQKNTTEHSQFSSSTLSLLDQLKPAKIADSEEVEDRPKIIFCSRTHSQLTQFINELRRVDIPSALPDIEEPEILKHIPLGSRKNLCINLKVSSLNTTTAITERCLDLQKPGISKDRKCEFMVSQHIAEDRDRLEDFKNNAIAQIQDIEDIAQLGRKMKICPYYASRSAIPVSEVITLPYPLLLQKSAREALGVCVKDNVVIIDEAHNLMSAIADTLSVSIPLSHLELAHKQLLGYCQKFKTRLKGKNRVYLSQIIKIIKSCVARLQAELKNTTGIILSANDLISNAGIDQIQPFKLVKYIQESKLVYKLEGYAEKMAESTTYVQGVNGNQNQPPKGIFSDFQNLLIALMNPASEGRFFILKIDGALVLKYSLLDPQAHFHDIVQDARSIILAGGTMSPMSDYAEQLFPYLELARLKMYSFGHVIDKSNLLVEPVGQGPDGVEFDFTWQNRDNNSMILSLASLVERICVQAPDGVVVFFPSYDYLALVTSTWKSGRSPAFQSISMHKQIFQESKGTNVDEILREYAAKIAAGKGALMLAVIGGKLSEGINFSDRLGRVVICVGLPYPNIKSAEWMSKVEYIEKTAYRKLQNVNQPEQECKKQSQHAGREFILNATMRAINQSIGRAIRHKNDYAAIYLVDKRYATARIQEKLPLWLKESMTAARISWKKTEENCVQFFAGRS